MDGLNNDISSEIQLNNNATKTARKFDPEDQFINIISKFKDFDRNFIMYYNKYNNYNRITFKNHMFVTQS